MDNKEKKLLSDILEAVRSIDLHLQYKRDYSLYLNNKTVRRSVEREMEIIGEAMNNLLKLQPEIKISSSQKIVDLRNLIIHAYDTVNNEMIWAVIIRHLPILQQEVEVLLNT